MSSEPLAVVISGPDSHTSSSAHDAAIDDAPPTQRLGAFELAFALAAMQVDDEPTVELPVPPLPLGIPSPLGDDAPPSSFEMFTIHDLDLELDGVFVIRDVLPADYAKRP